MVKDEVIYKLEITDKDVANMHPEQIMQLKHDLIAAVQNVLFTYRMTN